MSKTLQELEAEVMNLKEQMAEYARVKDLMDIWKLHSKYAHLYQMFKRSEIPNLFAQKTPGVTLEIEESGVYEGIEGVKKVFAGKFHEDRVKKIPGFMAAHMVVNPIVEINKEGTKARGIWFSHGCVSLPLDDNKLTAAWCFGKYDMEYVKEDGEWKFLKLAYRGIYMTPYHKGWLEDPMPWSIRDVDSLDFWPDKPTTHHLPYHPRRINAFDVPPIPEPYE